MRTKPEAFEAPAGGRRHRADHEFVAELRLERVVQVADPIDQPLGQRLPPGLKPGAGYVDVSTVDAQTAAEVGRTIHAAGGRFLEAPVSGSKGPAEQGALIFLAAGDEDLYERAGPALDVMGKAKFLLDGVPGAGARMKLVVNAML